MNLNKINIMVGRFQPLTYGHLKCAEYVSKEYDIDTILVMIDPSKQSIKSPFSMVLLKRIYEKLIKDHKYSYIKDIIYVKNANIIDISTKLRDKGFILQSWSCGTDRVKDYKKMSERYKTDAELPDDFQVIEIKRTDEDISATDARNALLNDQRAKFSYLTPLDKYYNSLRRSLKKFFEEQ